MVVVTISRLVVTPVCHLNERASYHIYIITREQKEETWSQALAKIAQLKMAHTHKSGMHRSKRRRKMQDILDLQAKRRASPALSACHSHQNLLGDVVPAVHKQEGSQN